jgi:DnaK suppressor protein
MDESRARALLEAERARVEGLLQTLRTAQQQEFVAEQDTGDAADRAEPLAAEGVDDAVISSLLNRLQAVERAERRLNDGLFGRSIRSGLPIADSRLEADPAAELTLEEAETAEIT